MKKIIRLTESDLTNIVNRVIKENSSKDYLIQMVKDNGWDNTAEFVGGIENLKKIVGIESPMDFLHLFDDLDVVQSEEKPNVFLYRYEKGNNMMVYDRKIDKVYINHYVIWEFLEEGFGLDYDEIQEVMKEWLFEVYNLRGVTPNQFQGGFIGFVV